MLAESTSGSGSLTETTTPPSRKAITVQPPEDNNFTLVKFAAKTGEELAGYVALGLFVVLASIIVILLRHKIKYYLVFFGLKKIGSVEFENITQSVAEAYKDQGLEEASLEDRLQIHDALAKLGPAVAGTRLLWVFEPSSKDRGEKEKRAFSRVGVDVDTALETETINRLYNDSSYDLVICGWESGRRLLPEIRAKETGSPDLRRRNSNLPVILYFPRAEDPQDRDMTAQKLGATGGTGSPGLLLRWGLAELARRRFVLERGAG